MPAKTPDYYYWDSAVFLAYVQAEPGRLDDIEALWDEIAASKDKRIITSTISIVEVAHGAEEKTRKRLDPAVEAKLDDMWRVPSLLTVDPPRQVMYIARSLMRSATAKGWNLKPADAVHLATAVWVHKNVNPIKSSTHMTLLYSSMSDF